MRHQDVCQNTDWHHPARIQAGEVVNFRTLSVSDRDLIQRFFCGLSQDSRYHRFMGPKQELSESLLKLLSNPDQDNHVAYLVSVGLPGKQVMIAEARYVVDENNPDFAEFAIAVADEWQRQGIAGKLLSLLERHAAANGLRQLIGITLRNNLAMQRLARQSGYRIMPNCGEPRAVKLAKSISRKTTWH